MLGQAAWEGGKAASELKVQCVKGMYAVLAGVQKLIEANEYDCPLGTVAIRMGADAKRIPVGRMQIERKDLIHDNFPLSSAQALMPGWRVKNGVWKVAAVLDGAGAAADGQLVARGPGTLLLGQDSWLATVMQVSAYFDEASRFALLGWVYDKSAYELLCQSGALELRKITQNSPVTIARTRVPELCAGWHMMELGLGEKEVSVKVDGKPVLRRTVLRAEKGWVGLRNYGDYAAFDNLDVQIVSQSEEDAMGAVKPADTSFSDIERLVFDK